MLSVFNAGISSHQHPPIIRWIKRLLIMSLKWSIFACSEAICLLA